MTSVYLAGASADIDTCEALMAQLRAAGCTITHDWTVDVRAAMARGVNDRDLWHDDRARYAETDLTGVLSAGVFWLVVPSGSRASKGCWVELGSALVTNKLVVASGDTSASIFLAKAHHGFPTHAEALAWIVGLGRA